MASTAAGGRGPVPWLALAALVAGHFLAFVLRYGTAVALPGLRADFRVDAAALGTLSAAYFWPYAVMQPVAGLLSDRFGARWPGDLPKAEDLEQSEPAPVSDSYAERRDTDVTAQTPSKWPGAKAGLAAQAAAGETALRYFSILGIVVIPLLLAAGWVAKYAREPHRSNLQERLRTMANSLRPRRRSDAFDEAMFVGSAPPLSPATSRRRAGPDWRERAPTDPAQDLKTSLAELMHDLRRAAEPREPDRYAERVYDRADDRAFSPSLQPAE